MDSHVNQSTINNQQRINHHRSKISNGVIMRAAALIIVLLTPIVWAQTTTGESRGPLASARTPLAGVEVRVKNVETGELKATTTTQSGEYRIAVAPGTYDVFASPIGYVAFARRQLVVQAGGSTRADGVLGDNPNAGTPG